MIVFGFLAAAIFLVVYLIVTAQRLGPLDDLSEKNNVPAASPCRPRSAARRLLSLLRLQRRPPRPSIAAPVPILRNSPPALVTAFSHCLRASSLSVATAHRSAASPGARSSCSKFARRHLRSDSSAGSAARTGPIHPSGPDGDASPGRLPLASRGSAPARSVSSIVPVEHPATEKRVTILPDQKTLGDNSQGCGRFHTLFPKTGSIRKTPR